MPVCELEQMLLDSTVEVMETMFFTGVMGETLERPRELPGAPWISARLSFRGSPSGSFGVRVSRETGRRIAATFLGVVEDSLVESQIADVIGELANMLCGSVLSRLEKETRFELSHAEIDPPDAADHTHHTAGRVLGLEEGAIAVWLELEPAP